MKRIVLIMIVAALGVLAIIIACSEVDLTEPEPVQADYSVYFVDKNVITYQFTPETGILDTLQISFHAADMTCSHDGALLYLSRADTTMIYDIATGQLTPFDLAKGRHIVVSPDGKYLALEGDSLTIVRLSDQSIIFQDTLTVRGGMFGLDGSTYFGGSQQHENLYVLALEPEPVTTIYDVGATPEWAISLSDSTHVFLTWRTNTFEVFDIMGDSFSFWWYTDIGNDCKGGHVATTSDRRMAFFCNPNHPIIHEGCSPPEPVRAYDALQNDVVAELSLQVSYVSDTGGTVEEWLDAQQLAVTPDNRWLIAITMNLGDIVTIELPSMTIVRSQRIGTWGEYALLTGPIVP